jgi:hypothetical protein
MITSTQFTNLAPRRTNPSNTLNPLSRETLEQAIIAHASCLLMSVPDLSDSERQFLYDIRRQEGRFPTQSWARLLALTGRSRRVEHRSQLGRLFDRSDLPAAALIALKAAALFETEKQGPGDVWIQRLIAEPTPENRDKCSAALRGHRAALDALIVEVERMRVLA